MSVAATPADQALEDLRRLVPDSPAQGLAYANALEMASMPERARDLRLAMFAVHVNQLNGHPPPPGVTMGAAMDSAPSLPAARPGTPLGDAWAGAFQRHVAISWRAGELPASYRGLEASLTPVRPGGWMRTSGPLPLDFVATVELENRAPTPITLTAFRLRWSDALVLDCEPAVAGSTPTDRVRAFVCGGQGPPSMRVAFTLAPPMLVPRHLETPEGFRDLVDAVARSERRNPGDWAARLRGEPDPAARAAARTAEAEARKSQAERASRLRALRDQAGRSLAGAAAVAVVMGLFLTGRRRRREGTDDRTINRMSSLVLGGVALAGIALTWSPPSGEGWGRAAPLYLAMLLIGIWLAASVLLILLHRLDRLLMQERTTWRATVRSARLGVLDLRGSATKGQWWGYAAFTGLAALSCLLVLPIAAPFVTLLLLVPLPALLWRRFRGLTNEEAWAVVALIVLVWLSWRYDF